MCGRASVLVWGECGLYGGSVPFNFFFLFFCVSAAVAVGCFGLRRDVSKRKGSVMKNGEL